ncbi:MAG: hypothetical protein H8E59_11850 [Actinobacteria bacterium]|nr:hypothetical protein [Actinomycetota bacterium]
MGISAVRPGDPPPMPPNQPVVSRRQSEPASNLLASLVASAGVVLAIIGTFLPWVVTRGADNVSEIGWDQVGDAVLVLMLGLAGAVATGALWIGVRGLVVKFVLFAAGAVLLLVAGLEIGDVRALSPEDGFEFRVGSGLPVIAVGGVLLFVAALLDRGPWSPTRG